MSRDATIAGAGAMVLALTAWLVLGEVPDAPQGGACVEVMAQASCEVAKTLSDGEDIDCDDGSRVAVPVEVVLVDGETAREALPAEVTPYGPVHVVDCGDTRRAGKVATARPLSAKRQRTPCIAGMVSKDTSEFADGSSWRAWAEPHVCCGDRCRCDDPPCAVVPDVELAGVETWRERLCEQRPEFCG